MAKGPELEYSGASGHDLMGREVVFIAGPDCREINSSSALDTAARLESEAKSLEGNARNAMLRRANELFNHAIRNE